MKAKPQRPTPPPHSGPGDDAIREYAYHLYEQSGRLPGRDLDNWLEASACLKTHPGATSDAAPEPTTPPKFGEPEPGHVHAAVGHARSVGEQTAHTVSRRHS